MEQEEPRAALQFLFVQLARLYFSRAYARFEALGVHPGQIPLLIALLEQDGKSQSELAQRLAVRPPTIAVMIRRMEKSGLIDRLPDENDMRVSRVFISKKGRSVFCEARCILDEIDEEFFTGLSPEELQQIQSLLSRVRQNALLCAESAFPADFPQDLGETDFTHLA